MARTVQCVYLKREAEGLDFAPYPGRARQAHLRLGQQGGLGGLDEAPDDARQRESPQSRRPARPPIPGAPDGEFLLRCRRRTAERVCTAELPESLLRISPRGIRLSRNSNKGFAVATLQELMAQREALERQIEQTKKQERGEAIEKVRALMAEYGLTVGRPRQPAERRQGEESQVQRQQGRRQVSQCLDRRNLERPRPAAALAEGGAGERTQAERLRGVDRAGRRLRRSPARLQRRKWRVRLRSAIARPTA